MSKVSRPVAAAAVLLALLSAGALSAQDVYYPNCDAARAAGAAPIYQGQPGYRGALDRDKDGVACE